MLEGLERKVSQRLVVSLHFDNNQNIHCTQSYTIFFFFA